MNEILYDREMLLNQDKNGIFADLLKQKKGFNTLWGPEYLMMNGTLFMSKADEIIEIMVKCRK